MCSKPFLLEDKHYSKNLVPTPPAKLAYRSLFECLHFSVRSSGVTSANMMRFHSGTFPIHHKPGEVQIRVAFGERKITPQSFRRARICKFSRQKRRFLQLRKYWCFFCLNSAYDVVRTSTFVESSMKAG